MLKKNQTHGSYMRLNAALLKSKGWEGWEIEHASKVIELAEQRKHVSLLMLDTGIYWFLLVVAVCGNVAAAFFLFPIVAFLPGITVYFIIAIVGLCLGALFTLIIRDVEKARRKHHLIAAIVIPLSGIVTFIVMAQIAATQGLTAARHSVIGVSLVYMIFFLIPYGYYLSEERFDLFDPGREKGLR